MSMEDRSPASSPSEMSEEASRNTLALNPLVGIQGKDLVDSAGILFRAVMREPKVATEQWLSFVSELGSIMAGKSERAPKAGDRRFSDPTWKESSFHSGLLKAYLAWGEAVNAWVRAVPAWTLDALERSIKALLAADVALKESRVSDDEQVLVSLILDLCAP